MHRIDYIQFCKAKQKQELHSAMSTPSPRPSKKRTMFTAEEDELLIKIMETQKFVSWKAVAAWLPNRNARQVRDRYTYYLSKNVNNGPWSAAEDRTLVDCYNQFGPRWARIATFLDARSENGVKNRWYSMLRTGMVHLDPSEKAVLVTLEKIQEAPAPEKPAIAHPVIAPKEPLDLTFEFTEQIFGDMDFLVGDFVISKDEP